MKGKQNIMWKLIIVAVPVMFVFATVSVSSASPTVFQPNIQPALSSSSSISLHGAQLIFNKGYTFKWSSGTTPGYVKMNFSAYHVPGSSYMIYVVVTHLTANSNSGYWVAGSNWWSGKVYLTGNAYTVYDPHTRSEVGYQEPFNQFAPDNYISQGSAVTITTGISATASATVCDASLSGTYSVEYSYNVPMFAMQPISQRSSNASFEFCNHQHDNGQHPLSTTYVASVSVQGISTQYPNQIQITEVGVFGHYYGWFNADTDYYQVEGSCTFQINV